MTLPAARSWSTSRNSTSLSEEEREEVGSSSAMTLASNTTALTISTIWRWPSDSDDTLARVSMAMPAAARVSRTRRCRARKSITPARDGKRPRVRFSPTVRSGTSCSS
jgi:hypothetical protein